MLNRTEKARYPLWKIKELITLGKVFFESNREKNRETLKLLGFDVDDVLKEIMKLTNNDFAGVDIEEDKIDADVYIKAISKKDIYIKFRIEKPNLLILSFHEDESGSKKGED